MKIFRYGLGIALALGNCGSAGAGFRDQQPADSVGAWAIRGNDDLCTLSHDYRLRSGLVTITFKPVPTQPIMEIFTLVPQGAPVAETGNVKVRLLPTDVSFDGKYRSYIVPGKNGGRLTAITIDRGAFDGLPQAREIILDGPSFNLRLPLQNTNGAIFALHDCERGLLEKWGIDLKQYDRAKTPAKGNVRAWFSSKDYPRNAIGKVGGRTVILASISEAGEVNGCRVVINSGSPDLDEATCKIVKTRGHYEPALDVAGQPVPSWSVVAIRWQI